MNECSSRVSVAVIGGAAGVGKTTLISDLAGAVWLNTGTFFKEQMKLARRDDVRKEDWTVYEEAVTAELSASVRNAMRGQKLIVVDTHFAAKLHGREYRIGLKKPLLFSLAKELFSEATQRGSKMFVNIVLIHCEPLVLLRRRRLDTTRSRELIPSDCVNDVRMNFVYSRFYRAEFMRARAVIGGERTHCVEHHVIRNDHQSLAAHQLRSIVIRKEDRQCQHSSGQLT